MVSSCLFLEDSEDFDQHTLKISLPLFNAFNVKLKKLLLGIFLSVAIAILYLFAFRVKVD